MFNIKKTLTFALKAALALSLYVGVEQLVELQTRGFHLQKIIATDLVYNPEWENTPVSLEQKGEIEKLLAQRYRFLGAGSECFAFASEDGEVVIKFFKLDIFRPLYFHRGLLLDDHSQQAGTLSNHPWLQTRWSEPWETAKRRIFGMREFRIQRSLSSIHLAHSALKEETGLLYLHLNPSLASQEFQQKLTIVDPSGIEHQIDLNQTRFFLQRKALPTEKHFSRLRDSGDIQQARASIDSLLQMIRQRCQKGFADRDVLDRNFGFIGPHAIEIDSGSFVSNPEMKKSRSSKLELYFATRELREWLEENYSELLPYLESKIDEEIQIL